MSRLRHGGKPDHRSDWYRSPFCLALAGGLALWAAFPPLAWWPVAWLAPLAWLVLIRRRRLGGRRPYVWIWLAALIHWLVMLQGIRLAHPALYLGWFALSAYLAVYLVLFVGLARVAVHRWRISIVLAAPAVWVGLELARGHAITGFSMALLGHTQAEWTTLIQISDIFGAYGVSFLVMFAAACMARAFVGEASGEPSRRGPARWWSLPTFAVVLAAVIGYGWACRNGVPRARPTKPALRVALVQGSFDIVFEADAQRDAAMFQRYLELSRRALAQHPQLDLIVWPESAFTGTLGDVVADDDSRPPPDRGVSLEQWQQQVQAWQRAFANKTRDVADVLNRNSADQAEQARRRTYLAAGTDTLHLVGGQQRRYNTALFVGPEGDVLARYYKMHRVPFGEYLLLGDVFPWLYQITPIKSGLARGRQPCAFTIGTIRMAPSICFESTVPHLIRAQIRQLQRRGQPPDALVNLTNDGWFWGSAILDFHLACGVFRAVENRLPMLVAANTGFSAYIDADGRIVARGPRRGEEVIYVEVAALRRRSWYQQIGDLPAAACLLFCGALAAAGVIAGRRRPQPRKTTE